MYILTWVGTPNDFYRCASASIHFLNIFMGNMLSYDQYEILKSSQILHVGPLKVGLLGM